MCAGRYITCNRCPARHSTAPTQLHLVERLVASAQYSYRNLPATVAAWLGRAGWADEWQGLCSHHQAPLPWVHYHHHYCYYYYQYILHLRMASNPPLPLLPEPLCSPTTRPWPSHPELPPGLDSPAALRNKSRSWHPRLQAKHRPPIRLSHTHPPKRKKTPPRSSPRTTCMARRTFFFPSAS